MSVRQLEITFWRKSRVACELNVDIMASKLSIYVLQLQQESEVKAARVFTTESVRQWEIAFSW